MESSIVEKLVKLSSLSYLEEDSIRDIINERPLIKKNRYLYSLQMKPHFHSSEKDCQFIVTKLGDVLIVSFRGTSSKRDVITDMNVFTSPLILRGLERDDLPRVHRGFLNQFLSVVDKVETYIRAHDLPGIRKDVYFTGHSLGGALATIASLYFSFQFPNLIYSCVTFGSPRVGDTKFCSYFRKTIRHSSRYVNDYDPVPCIPTTWRFKHVHGVKWLKGDQMLNKIPGTGLICTIKNIIISSFGIGYNPINDHSCLEYIKDLKLD